jgi:myo-inositol-1(or 4)-monophosphatase
MEPIAVAIEAAHQAGELILHRFRKPQEVRNKGPQDVVTEADVEAEELIVDIIRNAFPQDQFLGEERHVASAGASRVWVIDPLDGTRNYAMGIPFFCTSIALSIRGKAVVGVIHDPLRGETFTALVGQGACLNGQAIHVVPKSDLGQAILYVGFLPAANPENPGLALPMFNHLRSLTLAMRNMGSAALSLAYLACGRLHIAYHDHLNAWDVLAGQLLIKEAGGLATDFAGKPICISSSDIIAASSAEIYTSVFRIARQVMDECQILANRADQ